MKQALTEWCNKYVLVPVDKTTSNFAIICWRYYALTLLIKLSWTKILEIVRLKRNTRNNTTSTYETGLSNQN